MTERQHLISLALDSYASAQQDNDVERAVFYRAKILELAEMRDLSTD